MKKETIGQRLKAIRVEKGYSLEEVGKALGVHKTTVGRWENSPLENGLRLSIIQALANFYNVSPLEFMDLEDYPEEDEKALHVDSEGLEKMINNPQIIKFCKQIVDLSEDEKLEVNNYINFVLAKRISPESKK